MLESSLNKASLQALLCLSSQRAGTILIAKKVPFIETRVYLGVREQERRCLLHVLRLLCRSNIV